MKKNVDYEGCIELIGAVIKQAIEDFRAVHDRIQAIETEYDTLKKIKNRNITQRNRFSTVTFLHFNYQSAKTFLFNRYGLQSWIRTCGISDILNIDYVRKMALKGLENEDEI